MRTVQSGSTCTPPAIRSAATSITTMRLTRSPAQTRAAALSQTCGMTKRGSRWLRTRSIGRTGRFWTRCERRSRIRPPEQPAGATHCEGRALREPGLGKDRIDVVFAGVDVEALDRV